MDSIENVRKKAIRQRIKPKLYDATYMMTANNVRVFNELIDIIVNNGKINGELKVLDLGCGFKPFKQLLLGRFHRLEYIGVDHSMEFADPDLVLDLNYDKLPFDSEYFDLIIISETLEHLYNPKNCLEEALRVLKPDGHIYVSTPFLLGNHDAHHDYYRYTDLFYKRFASENGLTIVRLEKSGSIISSFLLIMNLILQSFQRGKEFGIFSPFILVSNLVGIFIESGLNFLSKRFQYFNEGKEYLYFGIAVVFRKPVK